MGTDAGEGWVIILGVVCIASVLAVLMWRVRTATRQTDARRAHTTLAETPPKHFVLTPGPARPSGGARRV
jgi:hypothetical protein